MIRATFAIEHYPVDLARIESMKGDCATIYRESGLPKKTVDIALDCIGRFPTDIHKRAVLFYLLTYDYELPQGD
jgi:hypothetical protein